MTEADSQHLSEIVHDTLQERAYMDDSLKSAKALSADSWSADDHFKKFNSLTYGKGGKILNMFMHCIGEETFYKAVRAYLKEK